MKTLGDANCKRETCDRLGRVRPETPRLWGKMTAPQMICHVRDSFLGVMGGKPFQKPKGLNLWPLMKGVALYMPMHWPRGVATRPEFDQQDGGTPPEEFERDVHLLIETIERFTAQPRTVEFRPHPMFGAMSGKDWMRWGYLHVDHHLRQFGR